MSDSAKVRNGVLIGIALAAGGLAAWLLLRTPGEAEPAVPKEVLDKQAEIQAQIQQNAAPPEPEQPPPAPRGRGAQQAPPGP